MNRSEELSNQLDDLRRGELSFAKVIKDHANRFGAADGVVFELDRRRGTLGNFVSLTLPGGGDEGDNEYTNHINSINPRMQFSMAHAPGHVAVDHMFVSDDEMRRNEFYDWLKREHGMRYFMGSRLYDEGDITVFHSVEFGGSNGPPDRKDLQEFTQTSRQLGNAWRIARRGGPPGASGQWAPEHLPWAIIALNGSGHLVEANSAAAILLAEGNFLSTDGQRILPTHRGLRDAFDNALLKSIKGERGELLLKSKDQQNATVQIIPVAAGVRENPTEVVAIAYIWDPFAAGKGKSVSLSALWGLSQPEVQLVEALDCGETLEQAAELMNISRNTARNHLQSVFAKMGVNRQSELIRRLGGLLKR